MPLPKTSKSRSTRSLSKNRLGDDQTYTQSFDTSESQDIRPLIKKALSIFDQGKKSLTLPIASLVRKFKPNDKDPTFYKEDDKEILLLVEVLNASYKQYEQFWGEYTLLDNNQCVNDTFKAKFLSDKKKIPQPKDDEEQKKLKKQESVPSLSNTSKEKGNFQSFQTVEELMDKFWANNEQFFIDWDLFLKPRKFVQDQFPSNLYNFLHVIELVNEPLRKLQTEVKKNIEILPDQDLKNSVIFVFGFYLRYRITIL